MALLKKTDILTISRITLLWIGVSCLQFFVGYATMIEMGYDFAANNQSPWVGLRASLLSGLIGGILGGTMIVITWKSWLRSLPYGEAILKLFLTFTGIFAIVALVSTSYFQSQLKGLSFLDPALWGFTFQRMFSANTLVPYSFWLIIVLITLISLLVDDKYGPGIFRKFLLGKYFQPHREERIFMFLDLRGSTSIAEAIGEVEYFNFLKKTFQTITPAILNNKGEIYQYVGDEIVISWPVSIGLNGAKCIYCFYDIQKSLESTAAQFQAEFGQTPEFKAGLHMGPVMTGEMGVIKREIAYSGDVLNTTARIQSKCNELGVDLLLSDTLMEELNVHKPEIQSTSLGKISLRGKAENLELHTI